MLLFSIHEQYYLFEIDRNRLTFVQTLVTFFFYAVYK